MAYKYLFNILSIAEHFQFGKSKPKYTWYTDEHVGKVLKGHIGDHNRIAIAINQYAPPVLPKSLKVPYYTAMYPNHKAKVDQRHQEGIKCLKCSEILPLFRHIPRLTEELKLSPKQSSYHPQPLKACKCQELKLLVCHRGIPRIYSDTEQFALVTYIPTDNELYELNHTSFEYANISPQLLDGLKVVYEGTESPKEDTKILGYSNSISLGHIKSIASYLLLSPIVKLPYTNRAITASTEHFRRYAYTYKIIVFSKELLYLPNGFVVPTDHPKVREVLMQSYKVTPELTQELQSILNNATGLTNRDITYQALAQLQAQTLKSIQVANYYSRLINRQVSEALDLPHVELQLYLTQTIGLLHYTRLPKGPQFFKFNNSYFTTQGMYNALARLKHLTARLLRETLLNPYHAETTISFIKQTFSHRPLQIPPISTKIQNMALDPKKDISRIY